MTKGEVIIKLAKIGLAYISKNRDLQKEASLQKEAVNKKLLMALAAALGLGGAAYATKDTPFNLDALGMGKDEDWLGHLQHLTRSGTVHPSSSSEKPRGVPEGRLVGKRVSHAAGNTLEGLESAADRTGLSDAFERLQGGVQDATDRETGLEGIRSRVEGLPEQNIQDNRMNEIRDRVNALDMNTIDRLLYGAGRAQGVAPGGALDFGRSLAVPPEPEDSFAMAPGRFMNR